MDTVYKRSEPPNKRQVEIHVTKIQLRPGAQPALKELCLRVISLHCWVMSVKNKKARLNDFHVNAKMAV